jgi:chemotaxis protein CheZ
MIGSYAQSEVAPRTAELRDLRASPYEGQRIGSDLASDLVHMRHSDIPTAVDKLDAVMQVTECAANQIMDACSALEAVGRDAGGEVAQAINAAVAIIYEACSFQDLTGQRIVNVADTLGLIEGKLADLALMVGMFANEVVEATSTGGGELLAGPQRPEHAIDQATVDRLIGHLS